MMACPTIPKAPRPFVNYLGGSNTLRRVTDRHHPRPRPRASAGRDLYQTAPERKLHSLVATHERRAQWAFYDLVVAVYPVTIHVRPNRAHRAQQGVARGACAIRLIVQRHHPHGRADRPVRVRNLRDCPALDSLAWQCMQAQNCKQRRRSVQQPLRPSSRFLRPRKTRATVVHGTRTPAQAQ